jgi:hypothetical protein
LEYINNNELILTKNNTFNGDETVDIQNITVNGKLPKNQRIMQFIEDIKDPYHYKCEGTLITVKYADTPFRIQYCLNNYINGKII